jgi:putative DNA primase/helicase
MSDIKNTIDNAPEAESAKVIKLVTGAKTDDTAPPLSDEALALRFADYHSGKARYVNLWGKWLIFDGICWRFDETLAAIDLSRKICREASRETKTKSMAKKIAAAKTVAAVERLARADRRLAATTDQWDRDPYLLGTPGGTVDLKTGKLRAARLEDFITKVTAVTPRRMKIPKWMKFLREATREDRELIRFLQIVIGYALTGVTIEDLLLFIWGGGGNGKSTFLKTLELNIRRLCGESGDDDIRRDLHRTTSDRPRHAARRAARHRRGDLARAIVGRSQGERANRRRQDHGKVYEEGFLYDPSFLIVIIGNHKPKLINVTEAMKRRLAIVEFLFKPLVVNADLEEELREEWPGILRWCIAGCLRWQRARRIARPASVQAATDKYFEEEDHLGQWVEDWIVRTGRETNMVPRRTLYQAWKAYAERMGVKPHDEKWLAGTLRDNHGFKDGTGRARRCFVGIVLCDKQDEETIQAVDEACKNAPQYEMAMGELGPDEGADEG